MFKITYTKKERPIYKYLNLKFIAGGINYKIHKYFEDNKYYVGFENDTYNPRGGYTTYTEKVLDDKFDTNQWQLISM